MKMAWQLREAVFATCACFQELRPQRPQIYFSKLTIYLHIIFLVDETKMFIDRMTAVAFSTVQVLDVQQNQSHLIRPPNRRYTSSGIDMSEDSHVEGGRLVGSSSSHFVILSQLSFK